MVWGAFFESGVSSLAILQGNQTQEHYKNTLTNYLIPFLEQFGEHRWLFQQDNASIHRAHSVTKLFEENNISVMQWSARSPDLNPIENLWGILARRVFTDMRQFSTVEELKGVILDEWGKIDRQFGVFKPVNFPTLSGCHRQGSFASIATLRPPSLPPCTLNTTLLFPHHPATAPPTSQAAAASAAASSSSRSAGASYQATLLATLSQSSAAARAARAKDAAAAARAAQERAKVAAAAEKAKAATEARSIIARNSALARARIRAARRNPTPSRSSSRASSRTRNPGTRGKNGKKDIPEEPSSEDEDDLRRKRARERARRGIKPTKPLDGMEFVVRAEPSRPSRSRAPPPDVSGDYADLFGDSATALPSAAVARRGQAAPDAARRRAADDARRARVERERKAAADRSNGRGRSGQGSAGVKESNESKDGKEIAAKSSWVSVPVPVAFGKKPPSAAMAAASAAASGSSGKGSSRLGNKQKAAAPSLREQNEARKQALKARILAMGPKASKTTKGKAERSRSESEDNSADSEDERSHKRRRSLPEPPRSRRRDDGDYDRSLLRKRRMSGADDEDERPRRRRRSNLSDEDDVRAAPPRQRSPSENGAEARRRSWRREENVTKRKRKVGRADDSDLDDEVGHRGSARKDVRGYISDEWSDRSGSGSDSDSGGGFNDLDELMEEEEISRKAGALEDKRERNLELRRKQEKERRRRKHELLSDSN